jgi:hypothetical protein
MNNIFIDNIRKDCIYMEPVLGGLADHDVKLLVVRNTELILNYRNHKKQARLINNDTPK